MTIQLPPDLGLSLSQWAAQQGISAEEAALRVLREHLRGKTYDFTPRDEWERKLLAIGVDCGVSLTDEQLSRDHMYD